MKYNLGDMTEQELQVHLGGFDASVRLLGQQLAQNGLAALEDALSKLARINESLVRVDVVVKAAREEEALLLADEAALNKAQNKVNGEAKGAATVDIAR